MKKMLCLGAMLLLAALLLSACKDPEPVVEETPPPTPAPTQAPTPFVPTAPPTVTPRPMGEGVDRPSPEETYIVIDPTDKPTPVPITFEPYVTYTSDTLGVQLEVPSYFTQPDDTDANLLRAFEEPAGDIRSGEGIPANLTVQVNNRATLQTTTDANEYLDQLVSDLRAEFPDLEVSSKADNSLLGETGRYVTFWLTIVNEETGQEVDMRGRMLVAPKNNRLYVIRYMAPSNYNNDYLDGVFRHVRATFTEL